MAQQKTGGSGAQPTLPAWKAFVVQFSRETYDTSDVCSGRVEHLNSGRQARFASAAELLAALDKLLAEVSDPKSGERR